MPTKMTTSSSDENGDTTTPSTDTKVITNLEDVLALDENAIDNSIVIATVTATAISESNKSISDSKKSNTKEASTDTTARKHGNSSITLLLSPASNTRSQSSRKRDTPTRYVPETASTTRQTVIHT
jgi:hypothetical protein